MDRLLWSCDVHSRGSALASCASCGRAMCAQCVAEGDGSACEACARGQRLRRRRLRRWLALGSLPLLVGVAALAVSGQRSAARREAERERAQAAPEEKMVCDRGLAVSVGEGLLRQGSPQKALDLAGRFFRQCGELPRLRWVTFSAHKELDQLEEAIGDATRLIEDRPGDADFWWWRGELHERRGRRDVAAADYRQSIANRPTLLRVPVDLYDVYQALGRPCEALVTLARYLDVHPELGRYSRLLRRMDQARLRGDGCAAYEGTGTAVLLPGSADPLVRAPVRAAAAAGTAGTAASGTFVVDEQASYVILTRAFADRLGLTPGAQVTVTVGGQLTPARLAMLGELEARGARARHVEVAIVDSLPVTADGLLGLSFLWRFAWEKHDGGLTLKPRRARR